MPKQSGFDANCTNNFLKIQLSTNEKEKELNSLKGLSEKNNVSF